MEPIYLPHQSETVFLSIKKPIPRIGFEFDKFEVKLAADGSASVIAIWAEESLAIAWEAEKTATFRTMRGVGKRILTRLFDKETVPWNKLRRIPMLKYLVVEFGEFVYKAGILFLQFSDALFNVLNVSLEKINMNLLDDSAPVLNQPSIHKA